MMLQQLDSDGCNLCARGLWVDAHDVAQETDLDATWSVEVHCVRAQAVGHDCQHCHSKVSRHFFPPRHFSREGVSSAVIFWDPTAPELASATSDLDQANHAQGDMEAVLGLLRCHRHRPATVVPVAATVVPVQVQDSGGNDSSSSDDSSSDEAEHATEGGEEEAPTEDECVEPPIPVRRTVVRQLREQQMFIEVEKADGSTGRITHKPNAASAYAYCSSCKKTATRILRKRPFGFLAAWLHQCTGDGHINERPSFHQRCEARRRLKTKSSYCTLAALEARVDGEGLHV